MVDYIVWHSKYSVSVQVIDEEHKKIIGIINRMHDGKNRAGGKEILRKFLDELVDYAMTHFSHEEALLKKYGYLEFSRHRLQHREFVKKIGILKQTFSDNHYKLLDDLFEFLKKWWLNHIQIEDKKFGPFLNSKGIR